MKNIIFLMAAITLAGCAVQHPTVSVPVSPKPPIDDAWVEQHQAGNTCIDWAIWHDDAAARPAVYSVDAVRQINAHYEKCEGIKRQRDYALRLMWAAAAVMDAHWSETGAKEWTLRKEEWIRLSDQYSGITQYLCPAGWTLYNQTCWAFRPITEPDMAMEFKDGAQCHYALSDWAQCLCEQPAKTTF